MGCRKHTKSLSEGSGLQFVPRASPTWRQFLQRMSRTWWQAWFCYGLFISFSMGFSVKVSALSPDGYALLAFKAGLNYDSTMLLADWTELQQTPCKWRGIICNRGLRVRGIFLPQLNLSGTISRQIGDIETLQTISLGKNNLAGPIPPSIFNLSQLQYLDLGENLLNGSIPSGFPRLVNLEFLSLKDNFLVGGIPEDFANQSAIFHLDLSGNGNLNGIIPHGIGNLSSLRYIDAHACGITGELSTPLGDLAHLEVLLLHENQLEGPIPYSFGRLDNLQVLDLSSNMLTSITTGIGNFQRIQLLRLHSNRLSGTIPPALGKLNMTLTTLDLANNQLSGNIPDEIGSLSRLVVLYLNNNKLSGTLPPRVPQMAFLEDFSISNNFFTGELSPALGENQPLKTFDASKNSFIGPVPSNICKLGKLNWLILSGNLFSGNIPNTLGNCTTLFGLRLDQNALTGMIPTSLGNCLSLNHTDLGGNKLTGPIPEELANCSSLTYLSLTGNQLTGEVPKKLGNLINLTHLEAAYNGLTGTIPVELCFTQVTFLDFSHNRLSGDIPVEISTCRDLKQLLLIDNRLTGMIPPPLAWMASLRELYLANNSLEGPIPPELASSLLEKLDVSYNNLSGPVAEVGFLASLNASEYRGNPGLCAINSGVLKGLQPCVVEHQTRGSKGNGKVGQKLVTYILAGTLIPGLLCISICYFCTWFCSSEWFRRYLALRGGVGNSWSMTMYHPVPDLTLEDVLRTLDENNVIGSGSGGSSSLYRGEIPAGAVFRGRTRTENQGFVVKKITRSAVAQGVVPDDNEFKAEIEALGKIKHNNIIKLWACCEDHEDTKLLVFEYMPNGSVLDLLQSPNAGMLDWGTRLQIALDTAQGLSYLHHDCVPAIVHQDVKSSSIILDQDFNARLTEFRLAKHLPVGRMLTISQVRGSRGYIAPELAYSMSPSEKTDVFSYGVVLLELVTGRRPMEETEGEIDGEDIVSWTRWKMRQKHVGLQDSLDKRVEHTSEADRDQMRMLIRIALFCTNQAPVHRPCMRDVVRMIVEAKSGSCFKRNKQSTSQLLPGLLSSTASSSNSFKGKPNAAANSPEILSGLLPSPPARSQTSLHI